MTPQGYKKSPPPPENEIKKMIMLRRQAWHNDDEFDYIVKNSEALKQLGLSQALSVLQ